MRGFGEPAGTSSPSSSAGFPKPDHAICATLAKPNRHDVPHLALLACSSKCQLPHKNYKTVGSDPCQSCLHRTCNLYRPHSMTYSKSSVHTAFYLQPIGSPKIVLNLPLDCSHSLSQLLRKHFLGIMHINMLQASLRCWFSSSYQTTVSTRYPYPDGDRLQAPAC